MILPSLRCMCRNNKRNKVTTGNKLCFKKAGEESCETEGKKTEKMINVSYAFKEIGSSIHFYLRGG